jgi:hypothetical protein
MDHAWARQLRDKAKAEGAAYFFKQSSGARAGQGDLLDGRRWREFPEVPPVPQADAGGPAFQGEELRQAEEVAREQEQRRLAEERLAAERERERQEKEDLRAELRRQQQEAESLRAELKRQRQETERVRVEGETRWQEERDRYLDAGSMATLWLFRANQQLHRAIDAERRVKELQDLHFWVNGFTRQTDAGAVRPSDQDLAVLGLQWPCTPDDVKKAYRAGAMKAHPDRGGSKEEFNKLQTAYESLQKTFPK